MRRLIFAGCFVVAAAPALADVTALCKLDKGMVTVAFTNPEARTMQCEVNCNMAARNGIGTVVCVKPVPGGAKDLVMCTEKSEANWSGIKAQEVNCYDPQGTPVTPEQQKAKEEEDDKASDELILKLQKQSLDMLKQLQEKQSGK